MQQWTSEAPNAGFTAPTTTPWLPVPPSARTVNAEGESRQPDSLLNFYKTLLKLRHTEPALMFGDYVTLNPEDPNIFSFLRRVPPGKEGPNIVVALNMSGEKHVLDLSKKDQGIGGKRASVLASNCFPSGKSISLSAIELPAFGTAVLSVQ